ncbi:MAG: amidohydrolase [Deltaproteobacteria bacterium]|nr:amidohydrolase [Deltaproteobacteria bacterium]MBW2499781.1 amidohydrolase [Deltaproteobacteria bacterium]
MSLECLPRTALRSVPTLLCVVLTTLLAAACKAPPEPEEEPELDSAADVIFHGTVLTLVEDESEAEALAIRGEEIVAVGTREEVDPLAGSRTRIVTLDEGALLPGFIDAHGHVAMLGMYSGFANIASPPVGPVEDLPDLQEVLRAHAEGSEGWIVGRGYDESLLREGRHPTRDDLDAVSRERPIFLVHVSGHLGAANSKALELAGIDANTPDPKGGVIRRREGSREPDGVLEEHASFAVYIAMPRPTGEQAMAGLQAALAEYAANGFTTVQDGAAAPETWALLAGADRAGLLRQDLLAYATWASDEALAGIRQDESDGLERLRLGGIKLVLDGSPQGKTAYLSEPYHVPPRGQGASYRGYPALSDEEVIEQVEHFAGQGYQLMIHANGDAAIDQMIAAIDVLETKDPARDRRPILIHGQATRPDQVPQFARLRIVPSFFAPHTFFWGDWHRDSVLGPERAAHISPTASARAAGIRFTVHMDAPVLPPDSLRMIWSTVNRQTRSGQVLGPDQRIPVMAAIAATTRDAAYQHFEEDRKGTLEVGKLADLVVLSRDPRSVPAEDLVDLTVLETWSHGERIYAVSGPSAGPQ